MSYLATTINLAQDVTVTTQPAGNWLKDNVVFLLLVGIGVILLVASGKGNFSKVASVFSLGLVGLFWIGLAFSGKSDGVSTFLLELFGI